MANSKIEWTEKVLPGWLQMFEQYLVKNWPGKSWVERIKEFVDVAIALFAVAGSARRDDIRGGGFATSGYWGDVVPGIGRAVTIGAFAAKRFEQSFLSLYRYRGHASLTCVGMLAAFLPVAFISCISLSVTFGPVFPTQPPLSSVHPCLASRAPTEPLSTFGQAFGAGRPGVSGRTITRLTGGFLAVASTGVFTELRAGKPPTTAMAPFFTEQDVITVFGERDPQSFGRDSHCTKLGDRHRESIA